MMSVMPIVEKLDPAQYATKLFRDSTLYKDGKNIKDLSRLNRPLEKTVMIEFKPEAYSMQPENTMAIKEWKGDPNDMFLLELIPLMEHLAVNAPDFREAVKQLNALPGDTMEEKVHHWCVLSSQKKQSSAGGWMPNLRKK
jgi:import inner membrane translocase subunit TIM50